MAEQFGEKTHDATPHRRQQAREKGQVAYSQDLSSALVLLGSGLALIFLGGRLIQVLASQMRLQLAEPHLTGESLATGGHLLEVLYEPARACLPILLALMLIGTVANIAQIGFLFVPHRILPDIARLSPVRGVQRIFSMAGVMRLAFGLVKVFVIFVVAGLVFYVRRNELMSMSAYEIGSVARFLVDVTLETMLWVGAALLVLAIFDYAWQRLRHERDLRMTSQEIREEMKNLQGDPQIIARRRAVQRQLVANRMSAAVPKADVVVTNPTEFAVALQYDPATMAAPIVVAKGAGVLAQRIRRLALEHNIPIVEKKELARALYKEVEVNHPVPNKVYAAVAEVLAYVYQLKGKRLPGAA